jgi:hypothetical protein
VISLQELHRGASPSRGGDAARVITEMAAVEPEVISARELHRGAA